MTLTLFLRIASANLQPGVSLAILEEPMAQNTRKTVAWERHNLVRPFLQNRAGQKTAHLYVPLWLFFSLVLFESQPNTIDKNHLPTNVLSGHLLLMGAPGTGLVA